MFDNITIILGVVCLLSLIANVIFIIYMRQVLMQVFNAAEEASVIFTRLDAFREHLDKIYETPTFYGDETLNALLKHVKETSDFIAQYENVYSFTQPDLLEQLEAASMEAQIEDEEEAQEKE